MADPLLILCGGLSTPRPRQHYSQTLALNVRHGGNVRLRLEQLTRALRTRVPAIALDLLEVASYVYVADQSLGRGGTKAFDYGDRWRRKLHFEIPVRCPAIWQRPEVAAALTGALGFLTDDHYHFRFHSGKQMPVSETFLFDGHDREPGGGFEEVMLFSGGIDSFAGAADEILAGQRRVALVSHRPANQIFARQQGLVKVLRDRVSRSTLSPLHVALTVNKGKKLNRDFMQRSRSFLFAAAAATVALGLGLSRIRFYENGVTGLNLPISPQLLGARASRTTHPQTLARFANLFSQLFQTSFVIDNPYQWQTKGEVLKRMTTNGVIDVCGQTWSCVHTWESTTRYPHCGRCSQCIDRRLSVLAAEAEFQDPAERYVIDIFRDRLEGPDLILAERYISSALDFRELRSVIEFAAAFPEVNRAIGYSGLDADDTVERTFQLYQRHSDGIRAAVQRMIPHVTGDLLDLRLPAQSLFRALLDLGGSTPPLEQPVTPNRTLILDPERFEVRWNGRRCFLGNTVLYRLFHCLLQRVTRYVSIEALRQDVWFDSETETNTVQRGVGNLRRMLREAKLEGIEVDGTQKGHYRLTIPTTALASVADGGS